MKNLTQDVNAKTPLIVFMLLILLTISTVLLAGLDVSDTASLIIALFVASLKGILILTFFMHLNHEPLIFKLFLGVAFLTLVVIFVLTFADYSMRGMS